MLCSCCEKDESGNWVDDPCCDFTGTCESDATEKDVKLGNCIHCGGEMFKEGGTWWHHSQEDIPLEKRGTRHFGI